MAYNPSLPISDANPMPTTSAGGVLPTGSATADNQVITNAEIGALTETSPATDTASSGLNGRLQRIAQRITSLIALLPTSLTAGGSFKSAIVEALTAGENHIGEVAGNLKTAGASQVIVGGATAYSIGDVINASPTALLSIPCMRVSGGSGYITAIRFSINVKSLVFAPRIHFFNANNPTVSGDNLPFKELFADASKRLGYWDMPTTYTASDTTNSDMSRCIDMSVRLPVNAVDGNLYAVVEIQGAGVTITAGATMSLIVTVDNN